MSVRAIESRPRAPRAPDGAIGFRLISLLSLASLCGLPLTRVPSVQHACSTIHWSAPDTIWGPRRMRLYVETPEILPRGDSLILIGSPSFATDSNGALIPSIDPGKKSPLFAGARFSLAHPPTPTDPARIILLPEGIERMDYLRATRVSGDGVAVVFRGPVQHADSTTPYSTVWTSVLGRVGWTPPKVVIAPEEGIIWSNISLVSRGVTTDLISAPAFIRDSTKLLHTEADGWRVRAISFRQHTYSSILAPSSADSALTIAFVEGTPEFPRGGVFVSRSFDDGRHWTAPVPASDAASHAIHHPRLMRSKEGQLALVWLETSGSGDGSRVHVALSDDRNKSWHEGPAAALSDLPTDLRAVSDNRGHVHVVVDSTSSGGGGVRHLLWDGARWLRTVPRGPRGQVIPSPTVALLGRDSVVVVWAMATGQGSLPMTLLSVGRAVCTSSD